MMLGLTMRMTRKEYPSGDVELRDSIAHDWPVFLQRALPKVPYVFLPNIGLSIAHYAVNLGIDALLFTGGDDWGVFPMRDVTEKCLFIWGRERNIPMLGVCRGAQIINRLLGGSESVCQGHIAAGHKITFLHSSKNGGALEVNSFHGHCIFRADLARNLKAHALAKDGGVEWFYSKDRRICGIMWHPERAGAPIGLDDRIFREFFEGEENGRK